MRVLITGASGFVGRHLASFCLARGAETIGLGRRSPGGFEPVPGLEAYRQCDLRDGIAATKVIKETRPDWIFHLAAEASVARSWQAPTETLINNLLAAANLLEATRNEAGHARALLAGSSEEYGPPSTTRTSENQPLRPQNPYAQSKAAIGSLAAFYADVHGLKLVRTRAFNHTGPGQSEAYVVSSLARQIALAEINADTDNPIITTGNLDIRRDFTDVRDVVRAYWLALERGEADVFNVCSDRAVAISEVLAGLRTHTGLEFEHRTDPKLLRAAEVMETRGSHDKLTEATGWRPEIPLAQTLGDTLDWWRATLRAKTAPA
jgi:GDP-4-dehydro-6-deoxy-D-mannose reductase